MTRVTDGSKMETRSSDDKIVESVPSKAVKMRKAKAKAKAKANTIDKLDDKADKIEETTHGLDEVEEEGESEGDEVEEEDESMGDEVEEEDESVGDEVEEEDESMGDEVEEEDESEGEDNEVDRSEGVENEGIENEDIESEDIKNEDIASEDIKNEEFEYEDDENHEVTADFNKKSDEEDEENDVEENEKAEEVVTEFVTEEKVVTEFVTEEKDSKEIDGEVESLVADVIVGSKNTGAGKDEGEKEVKDSATGDNMPNKKAKRVRKTTTSAAVSKKAVKAGEKVVSGFVAEEKGIKKSDGTVKSITLNLVPKTKNTEVGNGKEGKEVMDSAAEKVVSGFVTEGIKKNDGTVKSITVNLVPKTKNTEVGNGKEGKEVINCAAEEIMPIKKAKRARRKSTTNASASKNTDKADELLNAGKKETSAVVEDVKMVDGMGLIFMCNAKTKQDCFRFKVLGLPASKKELVAKIYKGMRLFLFDVDLKLMYGIFKAVTPGGYNIEPKAFNSAYPAQVRFAVFDDCLPLPEEKFKVALKENYYGRNKFNNQLSHEQVKKLCKLFQKTIKRAQKKRSRAEITGTTEPVVSQPSKRSRTRTNDAVRTVRVEPKPIRTLSRGWAHGTQKAREPIRAAPVQPPSRTYKRSQHGRSGRRTPPAPLPSRRERSPLRRRGSPRSGRAQDLDPYRRRRDAYASPPRRALPPVPSAAPYDYYYRHDPPPSMVDPRDRAVHGVRDMEMRQPTHVTEYHRDAYNMYGEPHGHYLDSYYASGFAPPVGQPAYASLPAQTAYAPLPAQTAYGNHPLYYHY